MDEILQTWNVSRAVEKFYNQKVGETNFEVLNTTITFDQEDEWKYFHAVRIMIGSDDNEFDWYPENVGSFIINWLFNIVKVTQYTSDEVKAKYKVSISDQFDTAFTIPEMNDACADNGQRKEETSFEKDMPFSSKTMHRHIEQASPWQQ